MQIKPTVAEARRRWSGEIWWLSRRKSWGKFSVSKVPTSAGSGRRVGALMPTTGVVRLFGFFAGMGRYGPSLLGFVMVFGCFYFLADLAKLAKWRRKARPVCATTPRMKDETHNLNNSQN